MLFRSPFFKSLGYAVLIASATTALAGEANDRPSSKDLARRMSAALKSAFPDTPAARREQAQTFLKLYTATSEMPAADRTRWQLRLKSRLVRLANAIEKDRADRTGPSSADADVGSSAASEARTSQADAAPATMGSAGGGPQDDGQALVELIQATIAPQSWDVNGGPGTIIYWPAWHVLVVRQTDDVHEQIGGVVHALRN